MTGAAGLAQSAGEARVSRWLRVTRAALLTVAAMGVIGVFVLAWLPLSTSFSHFVIEDFGYYLSAAREAAAGHRVSLDGEHVTNGFHPLWLLVLVALHKIFGDRPHLIAHIALTILAVAFVITGVLIVSFVRRRAARWLWVPIAAWFFCNYRLATIPMGGLETSLSGLAVSSASCFWE